MLLGRRTCAAVATLLWCSGCAVSAGPATAPIATLPNGFTDVSPAWGSPSGHVGSEDVDTSGLFADLDGDGTDELILSSAPPLASKTTPPSTVYRYDAKAGRFVTNSLAATPPPATAVLVDIDRDGALDAVTYGRPSLVWWGKPGGFAEPRNAQDYTLVWSPQIADLDGDGLLDVLRGGQCCYQHDACNDLAIDLATTPRSFHRLGQENGLPSGTRVGAYVAAALPVGTEPMVLAQIGSTCDGASAKGFFRPRGTDADGYPKYEEYTPFEDFGGGGKTSIDTFAPMSVAGMDLDGDEVPDMYVATHPNLRLWRGGSTLPLADLSTESGIFRKKGQFAYQIPWGTALVDLDLDGRPDMVVVHGDDDDSHNNPAFKVGPQEVSVFLNRGDLHFVDATASAHTPTGQWKGLTVGDFDCDGDADFIVGGYGQAPRVLRNDIDGGQHALSVRLRGRVSNALGLGAIVDVTPDDGSPVRHIAARGVANPLSFSEPLVFAGLGRATSAHVAVRWPSGWTQDLGTVPGGRCLTAEEPEFVHFEPPSRSAAPGGAIDIAVTPRDPTGSPRSDAVVTARIVSGGGQVELRSDASGTHLHVTGPASAGSSVLEIAIDGQPLGIQPRLFWQAP